MRFSEQLRQAAAEVWEAQHEHPFVRGIGDGTLDPARFRAFVRQDYLFLIEYGRVLALACARAPRLELMERFAELAHSTLRTEMDLHRAYAAEWGITRAELERERPQPATRAYTDFYCAPPRSAGSPSSSPRCCRACGATANWASGSRSSRRRPRSATRAGSPCIPARSSRSCARWCRELCDEAAADAGEDTRTRMREAFIASSRYELDFWESAWRSSR